MNTLLNNVQHPDAAAGALDQLAKVGNVTQDINEVNMFTKFIKSSDEAAKSAL